MQPTEKNIGSDTTREWITALNTSFITNFKKSNVASLDLAVLMQSPEFASLLVAAQHLAINEGLTKEEATDRIVNTFKTLEKIWSDLVIERGLKSLV